MPSAPVIALVPARSGSKGLPHKNLADLGGFPLLAYSVLAGLLAEAIDRVLVTSDAPELAEVGIRFGAEAPFLRPAALANDDSPDLGYVRHALDWLAEAEGTTPELVVQLRPTTPLRHQPDGWCDDAVPVAQDQSMLKQLMAAFPDRSQSLPWLCSPFH